MKKLKANFGVRVVVEQTLVCSGVNRLKSVPRPGFLLFAASLLSGCAGVQSALDPAGPQSQRIGNLWWLMFWVCSVIFVLVMGALWHAVRRGRGREASDSTPPTEQRITKIIAGALAVSAVILFVFM